MAGTTLDKQTLTSALDRAKASLARIRTESRAMTGRTVNGALTIGTGAGFAYLARNKGEGPELAVKVPGTDVDVDLGFGIITGIAGIAGLAEEYSDSLTAIGSGALTAFAVRKILLDTPEESKARAEAAARRKAAAAAG